MEMLSVWVTHHGERDRDTRDGDGHVRGCHLCGEFTLDFGIVGCVENKRLPFRRRHNLRQRLQTPKISAIARATILVHREQWVWNRPFCFWMHN
jgi:hypothetical protein